MKLDKEDQEFRNPKIFYPDPKNVELDRVLINLFMLFRCKGRRPVTAGRRKAGFEKVEHHAEKLAELDGVTGFDKHSDIGRAWLESDVFDLVNRGKTNEAVASLRPLHLEAHKVMVRRHCRDYAHADALYAMLTAGERQAVTELHNYLDAGRDSNTRRYDGKTDLDLETLTVLKLVEGIEDFHSSRDTVITAPPLCIGQARLLGDDVLRILAYHEKVPRPVMVDYLKTLFGLHLALYTLRLSRQLTGWIRDQRPHPTCRECPVHGGLDRPFEDCPFEQTFTVDMGGDFRSRMAQLAQESATGEYNGRLLDLIKSIFTMNQLLRHARENPSLGVDENPYDVLAFLEEPTVEFDVYFKLRLQSLRNRLEKEEDLSPELAGIFDAQELTAFERFIEVVTHVRQRHHMKYLWQDLDKLFQKNTEAGTLVQGRSKANPRRWQLGGRMLEVLVQLAVLKHREVDGHLVFWSEPILVDGFQRWLERRYGFIVGIPESAQARGPVTVEEHRAFRDNVTALKERLREIGFYDDLSDAYNAQTLRPRYRIDQRETEV